MEVRNCKNCGRLYNYIGGSYRNLCPDCINALEDKFQEVKQFIEEHKTATISIVSEECGVSSKQIEQWIREERLAFGEDSPIGIGCEVCGATIKSGRYCDSCKATVTNRLGSAYGKPVPLPEQKKRTDNANRMRYLNK